MKLKTITVLLFLIYGSTLATNSDSVNTDPYAVGSYSKGIPNHITDFGIIKGFISRSSWVIAGKNKPFRLNFITNEFFYAPGVRTNTTPTSYPSDRLDPDILFGAAIGIGPQISLSNIFYIGGDIAIGGGMSGVQWKDIDYISYGTYFNSTKYKLGYDWVPGVYAVSSAHIGLAVGPGPQFTARIGLCPIFVTGRKLKTLTFTPCFSAGFGF